MRHSEWVAFLYFAYLFVVAVVKRPWPRRTQAMVGSAAGAAAALVPATFPHTPTADFSRDWLPAMYLVLGYWLSGWYYVGPMRHIEARLLGLDWRVIGKHGAATVVESLPRVVLEAMELAYVACFLFVPSGMVILTVTGHAAAADRFWSLVLLAEFGSFAALPWIQTRPPRLIETDLPIDRRRLLARHLNYLQVTHTSIGVNTFPSGHVAGSLATAIAVSEVVPSLAPLMFAVTLMIAVAAVIGRYHYFADAVAGAFLALVAWVGLRMFW